MDEKMIKNSENGLSIIIPVYNEEESISITIDNIKKVMSHADVVYEIIVVNDGSTDATSEKLENFDIIKVEHRLNKGYGASLKSGIKKSIYNSIAITDADGTYPNHKIPELFSYCDNYDMVVGARTGENVHIPFIRKPAKWFLNKLANILTGTKIPDLNSGLRIFKKELVNKYLHLLPSGFSFTTTITLAFLCDNHNVNYIPIDYNKRTGKSKIKSKDAINFLLLIFRTIIYFNPLKVFLPICFAFFIVTLSSLTYDVIFSQGIYYKTLLLFIFTMILFVFGLIADLIVRKSK